MAVRQYSLAVNGDEKITPHFLVREFRCKDGSDKILMSDETVALLEKIRTFYRKQHPGATLVVISGYRTPAWNRHVGGAKNSQHVKGRAVDFVVRIPNNGIVNPLTVHDDINSGRIFGAHKGGLGRYRTFTHIDTGANRRWTG